MADGTFGVEMVMHVNNAPKWMLLGAGCGSGGWLVVNTAMRDRRVVLSVWSTYLRNPTAVYKYASSGSPLRL